MKNQYFGDIHDFKKYTLLKWFMEGCDDKLLVAWYLTSDDEEIKDGNKRQYLEKKYEKFSKCNKELFKFLKEVHKKRNIKSIEKRRDLISKNIDFFDKNLDFYKDRKTWFEELENKAKKFDIIFADPDNGIKFNNKNSKKHIKLSEIKKLWEMNKSLIIYQHFLKVDHKVLMAGIVYRLFSVLKSIKEPFIRIVYSSEDMMIFILHKKHKREFEKIKQKLKECKDIKFLNLFEFSSENLKIG